jgi:phage/plasmid-associated DNA primase
LADKANPYLINELITEAEMSALLRLVVNRLPRVLETGISYAGNHTIDDNYLKYIESSDPIRLFCELGIRREPNHNETKAAVYSAYEEYCMEKRLPRESNQTFSRRLKQSGFEYKQDRQDKGRPYVWESVKLVYWRPVEDEDQETLR